MKGFRLAGLEIAPPLVLAPMTELSDPPLRRLVTRLGGCGLMFTPMLSPAAVRAHQARRIPIATGIDRAPPLAVQILPSSADDVLDSVPRILDTMVPEVLDINMGCAAPRVRRTGAGVSLAADPPRARSVVATARRAWSGPLTVKLRSAASGSSSDLIAFCRDLESEGVSGFTIHGRPPSGKFRRVASWDIASALASSLSVPVVGSGDVQSARDALDRLERSGCSGVMIGRGALSNPWIFAESVARSRGEPWIPPTNAETREAILSLLEDIARSFPPDRARVRIDRLLPYLLDRFPFGRRAAVAVARLGDHRSRMAFVSEFLERSLPVP